MNLSMSHQKNKNTPRVSPEEYLAQERASVDQKHEYIDGEVFAMVGASTAHIKITLSIGASLREQLKKTPCQAFLSDLKILAGNKANSFFYPDIVVVCGALNFHDENKDVVTNPKIIVEVLSPSTEVYDRSEKFFRYQQIESLSDYILVSQDAICIEHRTRYDGKQWLLKIIDSIDLSLTINSISCTLELSDIYDRVWED